AVARLFGVAEHEIGGPVRRNDAHLVGHCELVEHLGGFAHRLEIGRTAHDDPDQRSLAHRPTGFSHRSAKSARMARFLTGINYWPRRSAMAMWDAFDAVEIDEDFALIASLGLDVVRFFLLWEAFQPEPRTIDRDALRKLDAVVDMLATHGLRGMPTFFTGHMSGVNWLPEWTLDEERANGRFRTFTKHGERPYGIGDFYSEPELFAAQRLQVRSVGERFRGHPGVYAWDLGNEFSNLRAPGSMAEGAEWSKRLSDELLATSGISVTCGTHGEDLTEDRNIRLSSLCSEFAFATMHGYPVYSAFARDRLDREVVPFLAALAGSFSRRPLLFSECGNPTCPPGTLSPYDREPIAGE